jgi:hypothetical protein
MAEVEKRVLSDVRFSLNNYRALYGGFPSSSPFADPTTKVNFDELPGTTEGLLPVHQAGETFATAFSLNWNIPSGGTMSSGLAPNDACIRWNECTDTDPDIDHDFASGGGNTVTFATGNCTWSTAEVFSCRGTQSVTVNDVAGGDLIRTYEVDLTVTGMSPTTVAPVGNDPGPAVVRLRSGTFSGTLAAGSGGWIRVSDVLDGSPRGTPRTLTINASDSATITFSNVEFPLGDDADKLVDVQHSPAALPRWFTTNKWHHFVYYAVAPADLVGGPGCNPGATCLELDLYKKSALPYATFSDVRAVAIVSGPDLNPPRDTSAVAGYFENGNASLGDSKFSRAPAGALFNDQIVILGSN